MNKTLKDILDILWYVVVFFLLQIVFGAILGAFKLSLGMTTIITTVLSSGLTIFLFLKLRWTPVSPSWMQTRPWIVLTWSVLLALGTIIPSERLVEVLQMEMPEQMMKMFEEVMKKPIGYVVIGILAPFAEEVVFRGAILRKLLGMMDEKRHWVAIAISALVFGLVHLNIPQGIHAFLIGLLLGWMYYRTRSILPGILFHWVNNSVAFIMFHIMPQMADGKLIDLFHGNERMVTLSVIFSFFILIPSIYQLNVWMKRAK
jgi:membrane protease YdiL (CAAX protease family)